MSSKAVGQHQGRRTPLSLTGGKHSQHQNNKNNLNANKNQETNIAKNGNNNPNKNQETTSQTQKELKKTQQNGNNEQQNLKKTIETIEEDVIIVEQNGKSNGHNKKNNAEAVKNSESNKDKKIDNEAAKEKLQKNETNKQTAASGENKQNEVVDKPTSQVPPQTRNNSPKPKDVTPTSTPIAESQSNEKKQTPSSAKTENNQKSATPTKATNEKSATPTPTKTTASKQTPPSKSPRNQKKITPEIVEVFAEKMAPLVIENSPPSKKASTTIEPAATSTPGKIISKRNSKAKTEIQLSQEENVSIDPKTIARTFTQISGRRSIRPNDDFTPSMYNTQFRESYRRINTELDVTSNTNTSMNVTVGSEIPNNSSFLSFSLFGRGRKRERTPPLRASPKSQSAVELSAETTPPKRARLDVHGIFTAMSSPLTLLRTRFSKTTLESSTPAKGKETKIVVNNVEDDVQNVSGVSIEEVVSNSSSGNVENNTELTATEDDITVGKEATASTKSTPVKEQKTNEDIENLKTNDIAAMDIDSDIKITETPIIPAVGDVGGKQRGCLIM